MEALDGYINSEVIVPDKNGIPVLTKVKNVIREAILLVNMTTTQSSILEFMNSNFLMEE